MSNLIQRLMAQANCEANEVADLLNEAAEALAERQGEAVPLQPTEPVANCWQTSLGEFHNFSSMRDAASSGAACKRMGQHFRLLYTHPPAQQPPLSAWIKTADQMPPSGQTVLVFYLNANGLPRRVRAQWIAPKSSESGSESDIGEYDEATDTYYDPEGWYEQIDNWDTYSAVGICGVEVTHWMSMPPEPAHALIEKMKQEKTI